MSEPDPHKTRLSESNRTQLQGSKHVTNAADIGVSLFLGAIVILVLIKFLAPWFQGSLDLDQPMETQQTSAPTSVVTTQQDSQIVFDNSIDIPLGVSIYFLTNTLAGDCGPKLTNQQATELMQQMIDAGYSVFRFWLGPEQTRWAQDLARFDHLVEYAREVNRSHGKNIKLIPVLDNHWHECSFPVNGATRAEEKTAEWYRFGYREWSTGPLGQSWLDYFIDMTQYFDNRGYYDVIPIIEIINEPETDDAQALLDYAYHLSRLGKSIAPNFTFMLGLLGSGQAGTDDTNREPLFQIEHLEFTSYHGYEQENLCQDAHNSYCHHSQLALEYGIPIIMGESGVRRSVNPDNWSWILVCHHVFHRQTARQSTQPELWYSLVWLGHLPYPNDSTYLPDYEFTWDEILSFPLRVVEAETTGACS